jgi:hypothetical protein
LAGFFIAVFLRAACESLLEAKEVPYAPRKIKGFRRLFGFNVAPLTKGEWHVPTALQYSDQVFLALLEPLSLVLTITATFNRYFFVHVTYDMPCANQ